MKIEAGSYVYIVVSDVYANAKVIHAHGDQIVVRKLKPEEKNLEMFSGNTTKIKTNGN